MVVWDGREVLSAATRGGSRGQGLTVGGEDGLEELGRDGEERNVLDIRVVLWMVRHQVMDVVVLVRLS